MSGDWDRHEGILLQTIPYLGSHRILKIFTPDAGLISLMAKHIKTNNAAVTTPFCRAEWVYRKSIGEIHPLKDFAMLDPLQELRESYNIISSAGSIARDLLRSQLPGRSAKSLYELLIASFRHLKTNPAAIALSFRLKLLQFEGLIRLEPHCMRCGAAANHLSGGESLCASHARPPSFALDDPEWGLLLKLGLGRRFSEFAALQPTPAFADITDRLFSERIH
ncbi:MAG: putative repair protein recO [Parachlamydiales bacterium]|nr:putative repair protein recO [Parachlamydiales bacterium]